jgi:hypothetical protein
MFAGYNDSIDGAEDRQSMTNIVAIAVMFHFKHIQLSMMYDGTHEAMLLLGSINAV